jgi:hypothetical protein
MSGHRIRLARRGVFALLALSLPLAIAIRVSSQPTPRQPLDPGFEEGGRALTPSERAGREIWFKATAGNDRFHTYVFQQRLGVLIDWYRVLNSESRGERFKTWGIINDPECCTPGDPGCPAKSAEETFGFDYCPGDQDLLQFVGKKGYRDPACDFEDAPFQTGGPHGNTDQRQSACDLAFGTSTGALGFRKFPNPRFDRERWRRLNGTLESWGGYDRALAESGPDSRTSRLLDASIEPPFLIGMSCGACHIAFNPLKPPLDPEHPQWENIDGLVGNQYSRASEIMASGMSANSLEWQIFSHARPGTVDTSAVPNDQVNNPGTMNPLMNLSQRPTFEHQVTKWRPVSSCSTTDERSCWCEPGRNGKCWERSQKSERVHHILKGGEDSIGALEAIQRVYFNIGSCSEECWVNHITDLRQADPKHRGFGQTPFDIGQCRRDCANFRAIEDRLQNVLDFLMTGRHTDLYRARGLANEAALETQLDAHFGQGAVARGRQLFAKECALCHSSQPDLARDPTTNLRAAVDGKPDVRADFLSSEAAVPVTTVGTSRSRALHSNHLKGHVWEEYGSDTLRARQVVNGIDEPHDGGRGYYRPISLLSVWAFAPFMHNNAIGPELCGGPSDPSRELYRSPYVLPGSIPFQPMPNPPPCWKFDPSVEGRYKLFLASMEDLLNPDKRLPKVTRLDEAVIIDGPAFPGEEQGFSLQIPAGVPAALVGNLRHKELVGDLVLAKVDAARLREKYKARGNDEVNKIVAELQQMLKELVAGLATNRDAVVAQVGRNHLPFIQRMYSTSTADVENGGHVFGSTLSAQDKKALIAFLATL